MKIRKYVQKGLVALILVISTSFASSAGVSAVTGVYFGSGRVTWSSFLDYEVRGYVYHNSNTSSALDINSMVQWVYNYGSLGVSTAQFKAHDANYTKDTFRNASIDVGQGQNSRVELDWEFVCATEEYSTSYPKNGSEQFAYTSLVAGNGDYAVGGWHCYWYPSNYDAYFNQ